MSPAGEEVTPSAIDSPELRLLIPSRQESELKKREEQLDLLFACGTLGDWTLELSNDMLAAHPTVWAFYGAPERRGSGPASWFREKIHPEDRARVRQGMLALIAGTAPLDIEFRVALPNKPIRWLVCRGSVVRDSAGTAVRVYGLNLDITRNKLASDETEKQLRILGNALPQVVWTARPDGFVDYYNDRWYEFFDRTRLGGGDDSWTPALHPDDVARCMKVWYESVRTLKPYELEFRLWDKQRNEYRWHLGRALPTFDAEGSVIRWLGTCTDIHDQKTAESRLEAEVNHRTEALSQSLKEKETLLKEVHHRVKNNLTVISSLLSLQMCKQDSEPARIALQESQQRVLSIALVHEHLYGNERLDRIDFAQYIRDLLHNVQGSLSEVAGNIRIVINAEPLEIGVHRAVPCGLILNELVTNAFKYAFPGRRQGTITIALEKLKEGLASLSVNDDGVGLQGTFPPGRPDSIGLQVVNVLTKQLDGILTAASSGGTHFELIFPFGSEAGKPKD